MACGSRKVAGGGAEGAGFIAVLLFPVGRREAGSLGSELRWEWLGDMALYFCYMLLGSFGLQILVVACVLLASFFVIKSGSDRLGGWTLLLLVAVCLGTYQLQLLRNSLFCWLVTATQARGRAGIPCCWAFPFGIPQERPDL